MTTLVDSNVLLDIITDDPAWRPWSLMQLSAVMGRGRVVINDIVYAEISLRFADAEGCDAFLRSSTLDLAATPRPALFLAAIAHRDYRLRGGLRPGVLPDFFIGAHATILGWPLLTRDAGRYRTAFPTLRLITP